MLLSLPSFRRLLLRSRGAVEADRATLTDQISRAHARWVVANQRVVELADELEGSAPRRQAELLREQASEHYKKLVGQLMQKAPRD
jgi:hypothetical protein